MRSQWTTKETIPATITTLNASRILGHHPAAPSLSRKLLSQRSHNNHRRSHQSRTTRNYWHQTPSHTWDLTLLCPPALPKLSNPNTTPFRRYQKTRTFIPCHTHITSIRMALSWCGVSSVRNHEKRDYNVYVQCVCTQKGNYLYTCTNKMENEWCKWHKEKGKGRV